jgi:hypothetical protein
LQAVIGLRKIQTSFKLFDSFFGGAGFVDQTHFSKSPLGGLPSWEFNLSAVWRLPRSCGYSSLLCDCETKPDAQEAVVGLIVDQMTRD